MDPSHSKRAIFAFFDTASETDNAGDASVLLANHQRSSGHNRSSLRPSRRSLAIAIGALLICLPVRDSNSSIVEIVYQRSKSLFETGSLLQSQHLLDLWLNRVQETDSLANAKFRILDAKVLTKRGLYGDAYSVLKQVNLPALEGDQLIDRLAVESSINIGLNQTSTAEKLLAKAGAICASNIYPACEDVFTSEGIIDVDRGNIKGGRRIFFESLHFARQHNDTWLESTALLNLGWTELQIENYDDAVDWLDRAYHTALRGNYQDLAQRSSGNLGWAYFGLGDSDRALTLFRDAEKRATELGNIGWQIRWLTTSAYAYRDLGRRNEALSTLRQALKIANEIKSSGDTLNILEDLAHLSIETGDLDSASQYIDRVAPMAQASGSALDIAYVNLARGKLAASRHEDSQAESLFRGVENNPASQVSMRFAAEHELALLYQAENRPAQAEQMYRTALATFEGARQQLKDDDSKLPFVANAKGIYDDYVRFLVSQNKPDLALMTADQSRARTLAQGLGMMNEGKNPHLATVSAQAVARKADATLLFYWLGERQSYLWAVTSRETKIFPLPAEKQITPLIERYNRDLLGTEDPVESGNPAGQQLYRLLVEPAEKLIGADGRVMLLTDGPLSRLNFEALIVPAKTGGSKAHYWIEDATVSSAPSISMLAGGLAEHANGREANAKLLLLGDPQPPSADYPTLPYAGEEMAKIEKQFGHNDEIVYAGPLATPAAYLSSKPEGFPFIHFVSHGVASRMDPLDSAIILSRPQSGDEDSFKLYAREIMRHPIQARLVTISACYGSGTRAYTGEGLVGLSWAFLRAGAQRTIGALWEASDRSTPELMSTLYEGLETGQTPASSLRNAKLKLLHSGGNFRKPFYWAAFQLYTRV